MQKIIVKYKPVKYKSALIPRSSDAPEPAHNATDLISVDKVAPLANPSCKWLKPVCFFNKLIIFSSGTDSSNEQILENRYRIMFMNIIMHNITL